MTTCDPKTEVHEVLLVIIIITGRQHSDALADALIFATVKLSLRPSACLSVTRWHCVNKKAVLSQGNRAMQQLFFSV